MDSSDPKMVPSEDLKPIWQPCVHPDAIPMNQYRKHVNEKFNLDLRNSHDLHKWSISSPQEFWYDLWSYVGLVPDLPAGTTRAYDAAIPMDEIPKFFENSRINYAENVLTQPEVADDSLALIGLREGQGLEGERWTWATLREQVRKIRSALQRSDVDAGDRVAALISTSNWSIAIFLAAASLGAIFTSIASDLGTEPAEVLFQYSSPSWVLWNIMVGHLAAGTTLVVYDGSPTFPKPEFMLDIVQRHKVAYWGVSPRYLQQLESRSLAIKQKYDLSSLRMVQTGGSHLAASQYHWFYQVFPSTIHLTSVIGGTDLVTSWIGTDPAGPLYPGEIQLPMLGHDVDVADPVTGESVKHLGVAGEFICRQPFPSMPVFMWGDEGNKRYKASYFERFEFPCWAQHDWASFNPVTGGSQVHGRSDGVLNPQGIRFGSSEIYSITEAQSFNDTIETTLCVGRTRKEIDDDESVFLFVVMRQGCRFDAALDERLRSAIRSGLSARHVPRFVLPVKEIPMTVNGKKVETLVKETICTGEFPKRVSSTVVNPRCLEDFRQYYYIEETAPRARL
ncbi:acetoacetate- ligase [Fusarium albosuccineum]|uniref:Acetoacetate- ligase n=1 Tax=Fusarium albosuccineum TaxID=1237068 RepID=A0A8H4PJ67_9HYPO|nr:acetoacetate- ligase [Fusarium albosuccineum]